MCILVEEHKTNHEDFLPQKLKIKLFRSLDLAIKSTEFELHH